MSGGIEEYDLLALTDHLIGTDVLCDAARLVRADGGVADRVEQRGLAVVDVSHDGDDGRTLFERLRIVDDLGDQRRIDIRRQLLGRDAELGGNKGCRVEIDLLIDARHDAHEEQFLDDVGRGVAHLGCEILDGDRLGQLDVLRTGDLDLWRRCRRSAPLTLFARAAAPCTRQIRPLLAVTPLSAAAAAAAVSAARVLAAASAAATTGLASFCGRRCRHRSRCAWTPRTGAPCRTSAAAVSARISAGGRGACRASASCIRRSGTLTARLSRRLTYDYNAGCLCSGTQYLLLWRGYLCPSCRGCRLTILLCRCCRSYVLLCEALLLRSGGFALHGLPAYGLCRPPKLRLDGGALFLTDSTEHVLHFVVLALQNINNGIFVRLEFFRQIGDSVFRF